jgi:hypothetical protein
MIMSSHLDNLSLGAYENGAWYALGSPWYALRYEPVCERLTTEEFGYCVREEPSAALQEFHACKRLSDTQFDNCVKEAEPKSLRYRHVMDRLTLYQKAWAEKQEQDE